MFSQYFLKIFLLNFRSKKNSPALNVINPTQPVRIWIVTNKYTVHKAIQTPWNARNVSRFIYLGQRSKCTVKLIGKIISVGLKIATKLSPVPGCWKATCEATPVSVFTNAQSVKRRLPIKATWEHTCRHTAVKRHSNVIYVTALLSSNNTWRSTRRTFIKSTWTRRKTPWMIIPNVQILFWLNSTLSRLIIIFQLF